jgi:hypothetical protein
MLTWLPPYRVELKLRGKAFGDLSFGTGNDLLISEAFREAWVKECLKGLDRFDPVEIVRIRPVRAAKRAPRYLHVVAPRTATAVDEQRSIFVWNGPRKCEYCGYVGLDAIHGFAIDEKSWTGEDIFYTRHLSGCIIATERFRKVVEDYDLKNARLIPVEEFKWDPLGKIVMM